MAEQVAWTYARAIVELAVRQQNLDAIEAAVRDLSAVLKSDRELCQFLTSPVVGHRREAITKCFEGALPPSLIDALAVIMAHNRQASLPDILTAVASLADVARGRVRVQVTTAAALDAGTQTSLTAALTRHLGADVVLEPRLDPALVGGMVVRYKDKVVDGSVKERLAALRGRLLAQQLGSDYFNENQS
jgi:F-type H+-transporting ATPase subunit delta